MVQFYFLAVLLNVLGGLLISASYFGEKMPGLLRFKEALQEQNGVRIVFTLVMVVVGVFKLLSVTEGDVPVVGDLLPALSLFMLSFILTLDYYIESSDVVSPRIEKLDRIFLKNSVVFGIVAMVIGILHFLFPGALLL